MIEPPNEKAWSDLAENLLRTGEAVFGGTEVPITERGASDVNVVAMALLCRTLSNLRGTLLLIKSRRLVEARILTRCCFENLIFVGGLRDEGYEFVKEMGRDHVASRQARGEFLFERQYHLTGPAWVSGVRAFLRGLKQSAVVPKFLNPKAVARKGPVKDAYLMYTQLSADAAHPSLDALNRYITRAEEDGKPVRCLDLEPVLKDNELSDTLKFACNATLGVLVGVNEILGGTAANAKIVQAADAYAQTLAL
jgi:hypothetical protein